MKTILLLLLLFFLSKAQGQKVPLNDSTYVSVTEDTASKDVSRNARGNYKINVYFNGYFSNDTVKIIRNGQLIFSDTIPKKRKRHTARLKYELEVKSKNDLRFIINNYHINLPFKRGYYLLYVAVASDRVNDKPVITYFFHYTNNLPVRL